MNATRDSLKGRLAVAVATCFYLSYIPAKLFGALRERKPDGMDPRWTGAGFMGTAAGWAALYGLPVEPKAYAAAVAAGILVAVAVSGEAERQFGVHDDTRIVVDETVGFWVAAAFLPRSRQALLAAFVLFRFLDAVKLPPYRWLERLPGGWGVVFDDVGAGVAANLLVRAAWAVWTR